MAQFNTSGFNTLKFNTSSKEQTVLEASITGLSSMKATVMVSDVKYLSADINGSADMFARVVPTVSSIADDPTRLINAYVDIYFNGELEEPVRIEYQYIDLLDIIEELKADSRMLIGSASANELALSFVNINREFSPSNLEGPYSGKIKPGVMIKPYLIIGDAQETVEYGFALGTFYSGDWSDNTDMITVSTTGYDRLHMLSNKSFNGTRVLRDVSYYDLYEALFSSVNAGEYVIDEALKNNKAKIGWLPAGKVRDALDFLTEASNAFCYVNRDNVLVVECINVSNVTKVSLNDTLQIKNTILPSSYLSAYSKLQVAVTTPKVDTTYNESIEEIARLSEYKIPSSNVAGTSHLIEQIAFLKSPVLKVTSVVIYPTDKDQYRYPTIVSYSASATHISIEVATEPWGHETYANIIVYGQTINMTTDTIKLENAEINEAIGEKTYEIKNSLIQDTQYATQLGEQLFPIMSNPYSNLTVENRGNPILQPGDIVEINDTTNKILGQRVLMYRNRLSVASGLSSTIAGYAVE